ncbi:EVE domain-containing protein [Syntrophotalea acetylenivorans]|uniref:EVE domain-containing protein n=1 Tax=Syntrophotalea acetylenivorans TaxID=1842532 RepID=A0A1L3GLB1_9BACT|nr:EVE domain-containing protein [Syntrophotalea acetylenivorans]APG26695.1 EVE domain-containing protein [Syntrophotalea acetylenivorans]
MELKQGIEKSEKRKFWLMKSEPNCFSLNDLKNRPDGTEPWDGVRNYQARNLLRDDIKCGDGVLFYHSNISKPAIVGLARVVREGYPDYTALDPESDHFDPRASATNPLWYMVDVQYLASLEVPITRQDLARHPVLAGMGVLKKGNRLSVQPVTQEQWQAVLQVAGLEDPFGL